LVLVVHQRLGQITEIQALTQFSVLSHQSAAVMAQEKAVEMVELVDQVVV
jgi:hypothetical protein